jgi:hypothetical protein
VCNIQLVFSTDGHGCTSNAVVVVCTTNVLQAAATYLAMVASGSLLYLIITAAGVKATTVDCCGSLILCSWIGPAAHLALLWLLPRSVYQRHRALVTLAFRVFYLAATSINGFAVCGVGPIGSSAVTNSNVQLESPMSAFLWRSGVIGLIWYAGAFPLLFWQHLIVQSVFLLAYWRTLSPIVCSSIQRIQYGPESIAAASSAAQMLWAQLLAAHGAPQAADAVLQAALQQRRSAAVVSHSSCMQGLGLLQVVVGHALPTFLLYCAEARTRHHWMSVQRQQQLRRRQRSSNASSSSGGQLRVSESWTNLLSALDPAGEAATAAAAAAAGVEQQQQQAIAGCSSKAAGAQPAAIGSAADSTSTAAAGSLSAAAAETAATAANRRAPSRRSSWRGLLGSSSSAEDDDVQQLLLDLPRVDAFDVESSGSCLPPNFREVYVLLLAVGLGWFGLETLLGSA